MPRDLLIKVAVDKDSAKAGLAEVERGVQQLTASSEQQEKAMKAALGVLTAQNVRQFVGDLKAAAAEFINAFSEQEKATRSLTAALQAAGSFTPELGAQYDALATHFEDTTVFSDELIVSMESLLTQVGSVGPAQMGNALKAATDLSAGLGIDLRTATILVAKAFEGHTETLGRYGIVLDETKLKADPVGAVLEGINQKFGGQAQAQLDTYSGKMQQLSNRMNNTQESAGHLLTSGISPLIGVFNNLEGPVQTTILAFTGIAMALVPAALSFATLAPSIAVLATSNLPLLKTALSGAGSALGAIGPAVAVVATAFASWEIGRWIGETTGLTNVFERLGAVLMGTSNAEVSATLAARAHAAAMRDLQPLIEKAERSLPQFVVNMHDTRMSLNEAEAAMKDLEEQTKKTTTATEEAGRKLAQTYSAQMKTNTENANAAIKVQKDVEDTLRGLADAYWKEQIQLAESASKRLIDVQLQLNQSLISLDGERLRNLLAVNVPQMVAGANEAGKLQGEGLMHSLMGAVQGSMSGLNNIFQRAFEGGGGALGAIKSFATNAIATLANMIPVVGPIISQFAGAIVAGFSKLFGGGEGAKVNDARDSWVMKIVGINDLPKAQDALRKLAFEAGASDAQIRELFSTGKMKDFQTAQEAIIKLIGDQREKTDELAAAAAAAAKQFDDVVASFDGKKMFADAELVVRGVEHIGGVSKLTAAEQKRVNSQLADAIEKYHVMGVEVPPALLAMELATRDVASETERLKKAADEAFNAWAKTYGYIKSGGSGVDPTKQALSPENYASYDDWKRAFLQFNPGDEGRAKAAYGSNNMDTMHHGGLIDPSRWLVAHKGMFLADEVPIIAQTGEGVLSRRGMRNLGGAAALNSLNQGGSGGGGNVEVLLRELIAAVQAGHTISIDGDRIAAAVPRAVKRRVGHRGF